MDLVKNCICSVNYCKYFLKLLEIWGYHFFLPFRMKKVSSDAYNSFRGNHDFRSSVNFIVFGEYGENIIRLIPEYIPNSQISMNFKFDFDLLNGYVSRVSTHDF